MQESGKEIIADHLATLVVHPTMVDRHLLLASEYKPYEDKWIKQVRKTITGSSDFTKINKLLDIRIPIEKVEKQDSETSIYLAKFCKNFLSHFNKMTKTYIGVGALNETEIKLADIKVNYLTAISKNGKEGPFFKMDRKEFLEKAGFDKYKKYKNSSHNHFTKTYAFLKIHEEIVAESKDIARRTGAGKETSIHIQGRNRLKYSKQLEKMVLSPQYKSAVLLFEIWSLITSVDKGNKNGWGLLSGIDAVGALVKTTAAGLKLSETMYEIKGANKPKLLGKTIVGRWSIAGSAFTVYSAVNDMAKALHASDNDAALAYSVAAGISGYLLAAELGMVSLSTGPFIVVAGIGLVVYGLAYYLTDSDLEKFFKHYPFSTQMSHATTSDNPFLYARAMYRQRDTLIKRWETKYMPNSNTTYKHLFVHLTNMLAGGMLKIEGSSNQYSKIDTGHYLNETGKSNIVGADSGIWVAMDIRVSFASFLQHSNQIEYEVYLLQKQDIFSATMSYHIDNRKLQTFMIKQDNGTQQLQIWLQVPKELDVLVADPIKQFANFSGIQQQTRKTTKKIVVLPDAQIAVLCRFKGNDKTIFPLTQEVQQGYLYTAMQIRHYNGKGSLIRRSFDTMIIKKQAFLNTYPLQNPKL
ncbi:hypothetical protein ACSTS3_14140 [Aquimarina muelleri]|uniref:hypothetical protein n=1 Tax=Aquimarina muelleri TaxID=279356 RepID=UPI003F6842EA